MFDIKKFRKWLADEYCPRNSMVPPPATIAEDLPSVPDFRAPADRG